MKLRLQCIALRFTYTLQLQIFFLAPLKQKKENENNGTEGYL